MSAGPQDQLAARLLAPALRYLDRLGHESRSVLASVGLDADIMTDPDRLIPDSMIAEVLERGVELTDDTDFGLRAGEHFRPGDYGLLELIVGQAGDAQMMIAQVNHYHPLLGGPERPPLEERGDLVVFIVTDPGRVRDRTSAEYSLVSALGLARLMLRRYNVVSWASFVHPRPDDVREHQRIFASELRFGAEENALAFPAGVAPEFSTAIDHSVATWLAEEAESRLERFAGGNTTTDRVRTVLHAAPGGGYSVAAVAYQLAVSERTLRRQLEAEGTSFVAVRDEVRRVEAMRLLSGTDQSVLAIALQLGFSDASGLHRQFKLWTGTTPGAYREASTPIEDGR